MENDVAIFVDLDNVAIGATEAKLTFDVNLIVNYIKKLTEGRIVLRRAYADWRQHRTLPKVLASAGFELHSTVNFMDKNLADMQMVVDAMETMIDGHGYGTYVLVTGDRDFLPLVQTLRKRGRVVIGIGVKHTSSNTLKSLVDKYVYYEDLVSEVRKLPAGGERDNLVERALNVLLADNQKRVPASVLKQQMNDMTNGEFGQSKQGRMSFKKFLEQYKDIVEVAQEDTTVYVQRPGTVIEKKPQPQPQSQSQPQPQAKPKNTNGHMPKKQRAQQHDDDSDLPLHRKYRAELKRQRLRVVPASHRLVILKDVVELLQDKQASWRDAVQQIYDKHNRQDPDSPISKSYINDVMRIMLEANVIEQDTSGDRFSASATIRLHLGGKRVFQEAVMYCDAAYLREIQALDMPFDWEESALALYGTSSYQRYLKVLQQQYQAVIQEKSASQ